MKKQMKLDLSSVIVQNEGHIAANMDGEKVMMNVKTSKYYNLGEIGGSIWDLTTAPIKISEVINRLTAEYDVSREQCEEQVITFLKNLQKEGLIQIGQETEVS